MLCVFLRSKGHADEVTVRAGAVRDLDRLGNNGSHEAADFGRRRVPWWVLDARRKFSGVCSRWRPIVLVCIVSRLLFLGLWLIMTVVLVFLLISLVWSAGSAPKKRRVAVRDRAFSPGPPDLWVGFLDCCCCHPYSVGMLVKWVAFLHSLHWPADGCSLGVVGVSYVELLILFQIRAGERLELEKAVPRYRRPGRSISVSAVPFGPKL